MKSDLEHLRYPLPRARGIRLPSVMFLVAFTKQVPVLLVLRVLSLMMVSVAWVWLTIVGGKKEICQWFLKGDCKFGHKCEYLLPRRV